MPPVEVTTVVDIEPPSKGSLPSSPPPSCTSSGIKLSGKNQSGINPPVIKLQSSRGIDLMPGQVILESELSSSDPPLKNPSSDPPLKNPSSDPALKNPSSDPALKNPSSDSSRRPSNTSSSSGISTSSCVDPCPNPNCPAILPVTKSNPQHSEIEISDQHDSSSPVSDSDSGIMSSLSPSEVHPSCLNLPFCGH